jgi:hypothetical protein
MKRIIQSVIEQLKPNSPFLSLEIRNSGQYLTLAFSRNAHNLQTHIENSPILSLVRIEQHHFVEVDNESLKFKVTIDQLHTLQRVFSSIKTAVLNYYNRHYKGIASRHTKAYKTIARMDMYGVWSACGFKTDSATPCPMKLEFMDNMALIYTYIEQYGKDGRHEENIMALIEAMKGKYGKLIN